jgi:hypothetical protein
MNGGGMSDLVVTCEKCGRAVDLTDPAVTVTPTHGAGYAFCPGCGEIVALDEHMTRRAGIARGDRPGPPNWGRS